MNSNDAALQLTVVMLLLYLLSIFIHGIRCNMDFKINKESQSEKTTILRITILFALLRAAAATYMLTKVVSILSKKEWVWEHAVHMRHHGFNETEINTILYGGWVLGLVDVFRHTLINFVSWSKHENSNNEADEALVFASVIDRVFTVFWFDVPSAVTRVIISTIGGFIAPIAQSVVNKERAHTLRYAGHIAAFGLSVTQSGYIIFLMLVKQGVESQTKRIVPETLDETKLNQYAIFQLVMVAIIFTLQTASMCIRSKQQTTTTTTKTDKQE